MNLKREIILICIICLTLVGCNRNVIKSIEVINKQNFEVYKISDEKSIDDLSHFLKELSWKNDDESSDGTGSESILLIVHYKDQDEEVNYAIYDKSSGASVIYNTSSKGGYVNLNKTQTKELNKIIKPGS